MDIHGEAAILPRNYSGSMYPPSRSDELTSSSDADNRSPRRNSSSSSVGGSTQGRVSFSHHLAPLKVDKYSSSYGSGAAPPLSPESEKVIASRIEELSQLESPLLRELAKRLGDHFYINTPRYEPKKVQGHPYSRYLIGKRWQEIQGAHNWAGLLDPIDPALRAEIVRYGEFAQACYDAFDSDERSKYCGSSKFTQATLLEKVGLESRGYEITNFIYSTSEFHLPGFFTKSDKEDTWSKDSNWMGFVAVCTSADEIARLGRRDIVIAWRGTQTLSEWIEDIRDFMAPAGFDPRNDSETERVMVEGGFLSVYKSSNSRSRYNQMSARQQVLKAVRNLLEKYCQDNLSITITGHSLGSALATLCAYDIAESGMNMINGTPGIPSAWYDKHEQKARELSLWDTKDVHEDSHSRGIRASVLRFVKDFVDGKLDDIVLGFTASDETTTTFSSADGVSKFGPDRIPITVYSFAGPKVGNADFCKRMEKLGVAVLRVVNVNDVVPSVPGLGIIAKPMQMAHHFLSVIPSYRHVGPELLIDNRKSPYLDDIGNPAATHNLEGYLHLVDGYQGRDRPFERTQRDFALANKTADILKPEHFIPPKWKQEENKGLIRDENGNWIVPEREPELFPDTPTFEGDPALECQGTTQDRDLQRFARSVSVAILRSPLEEMEQAEGGRRFILGEDSQFRSL